MSLVILCTLQGSLFRRESFPENAFKRHSLQRTVCHAALCKQKFLSYSEIFVLGSYCPQKENNNRDFCTSQVSWYARSAKCPNVTSNNQQIHYCVNGLQNLYALCPEGAENISLGSQVSDLCFQNPFCIRNPKIGSKQSITDPPIEWFFQITFLGTKINQKNWTVLILIDWVF